jgi:hypothetical protein
MVKQPAADDQQHTESKEGDIPAERAVEVVSYVMGWYSTIPSRKPPKPIPSTLAEAVPNSATSSSISFPGRPTSFAATQFCSCPKISRAVHPASVTRP